MKISTQKINIYDYTENCTTLPRVYEMGPKGDKSNFNCFTINTKHYTGMLGMDLREDVSQH